MDFNLSPGHQVVDSPFNPEFIGTGGVYQCILMLKKDHRLLKNKLEEQSRQIKNLSQKSRTSNHHPSRVIRLSGLLDKAGKESANFKLQWTQEQHARKSP